MSGDRRLLIVQLYLPKYRVPFFERLAGTLRKDDITVTVAAPRPFLEHASRGDAANAAPWSVELPPSRLLTVRGITFVSLRSRAHWKNADAVVMPAAANFLDPHLALLPPRRRRRVGLWGHIADFIGDSHPADVAVEKWMMRACGHVFAYTPRGADFAVQQGVRPDRVTTLNNTIDFQPIVDATARITDTDAAEFRHRHGIATGARVFGYVGGLDDVKRLDLLVDTLELLHHRGDRSVFLVAGDGNQRSVLDMAVARGQVVLLGYADAALKAMMGRLSTAIVNPGRIGLLSVDSLALGVPVVTSDYRYHGPEVEYLTEGESLFRVPGGASELASFLVDSTFHRFTAAAPTLAEMSDQFASGIRAMLDDAN